MNKISAILLPALLQALFFQNGLSADFKVNLGGVWMLDKTKVFEFKSGDATFDSSNLESQPISGYIGPVLSGTYKLNESITFNLRYSLNIDRILKPGPSNMDQRIYFNGKLIIRDNLETYMQYFVTIYDNSDLESYAVHDIGVGLICKMKFGSNALHVTSGPSVVLSRYTQDGLVDKLIGVRLNINPNLIFNLTKVLFIDCGTMMYYYSNSTDSNRPIYDTISSSGINLKPYISLNYKLLGEK